MFDVFHGAKWFYTLDLKSGFWQVEVSPPDREKTAFTTESGLWQFTVMPFGLCSAPATFQHLMETVLRGLIDKVCLIYLADVVVFRSTVEELLQWLNIVFEKLRGAVFKLSPKKCQLFQKRVCYLRFLISEKGLAADPEKTNTIAMRSVSKDEHEVRSFLGLCSYYRRFINGFAQITKPLNQLTEFQTTFHWTNECKHSKI